MQQDTERTILTAGVLLVSIFIALPGSVFAQCSGSWGAPSGYYDDVITDTPSELHSSLHDVINDHVYFPYTAGGTDTWDIIMYADEDPGNSANIIDVCIQLKIIEEKQKDTGRELLFSPIISRSLN